MVGREGRLHPATRGEQRWGVGTFLPGWVGGGGGKDGRKVFKGGGGLMGQVTEWDKAASDTHMTKRKS